MNEGAVSTALDRAGKALERIEKAIQNRRPDNGREERLRAKVREAIVELDELIRSAS